MYVLCRHLSISQVPMVQYNLVNHQVFLIWAHYILQALIKPLALLTHLNRVEPTIVDMIATYLELLAP